MMPNNDAQPVHTFNNAIKVMKNHLAPEQVERYEKINLHEPEEEELFNAVLREMDPSGTFVDVGAAIGYYCILAKKTLPSLQVHAFEPLPQFRDYLTQNATLNDLAADAIIVHAEAVAARCGTAKFVDRQYGSSFQRSDTSTWRLLARRLKRLQRNLVQQKVANPTQTTAQVRVTTLDKFIDRLGQKVDLIMVDVQGFEVDVLAGASRSMTDELIRRWLIGTHSPELHRRCLDVVRHAGYEISVEQAKSTHQPDGIILAKQKE